MNIGLRSLKHSLARRTMKIQYDLLRMITLKALFKTKLRWIACGQLQDIIVFKMGHEKLNVLTFKSNLTLVQRHLTRKQTIPSPLILYVLKT
jgi:hypothetical protein